MAELTVSVVVPTFYSGGPLRETLRALAAADWSRIAATEIIVVDDGSPEPVDAIVRSVLLESPSVRHRVIRTSNGGPAAARNTGIRAATTRYVICIDDDIAVEPDLIYAHLEAHTRFPGAVICGRCPFPLAGQIGWNAVADSLGGDSGRDASQLFTRVPIVSSGNVSFDLMTFDAEQGVYADFLETPAAEEYELSWRLSVRNVPIYLASRIIGWHNHKVTLRMLCDQAWKHGVGCAEVVVKVPAVLDVDELKAVLHANGPRSVSGGSMRTEILKLVRTPLAGPFLRRTLLQLLNAQEQPVRILNPAYRQLMALYFFAGVRFGLRKYGAGALT